jgi:Chitin binding Peritrophin-A domain
MMFSLLVFCVLFVQWSTARELCEVPRCSTPLDFIILHPSLDPKTFFRCEQSETEITVVLEHCPTNTYFLFEQQACIQDNQWYDDCIFPVLPPNAACIAPTCTTPLELIVLQPAETVDTFYQCFHDHNVRATCTEGTWFDFQQQACVAPSQWSDVCGFDTGTTTPPPPVACGGPPACVQAELGLLHPVAQDPNAFYRCEPTAGGFAAVRRECPLEFLFGFQQQGCVWPRDWVDPCR